MDDMRKVFYIDIDGTLTIESTGFGYRTYLQRTPDISMIEVVNQLYDDGHIVVLWSSRFVEDEVVTKEWLTANKVKYSKLILGKPQYDFVVDDKAYNPANFKTLYRTVKDFIGGHK